jgi:hypothetical protein
VQHHAEPGAWGLVTIGLASGVVVDRVARAVAKVLRERFGIRLPPDELRHRMQRPPAEPRCPPEATAGGDDRIRSSPSTQPSLQETAERALEGVHRRDDRPRATRRRPGLDALFDGTEREPLPPEPDAAEPTPLADGPAPEGGEVITSDAPPQHRIAVRELVTMQTVSGTRVVVTLQRGGRAGRGEFEAIAIEAGLWRAIAEATLVASSS